MVPSGVVGSSWQTKRSWPDIHSTMSVHGDPDRDRPRDGPSSVNLSTLVSAVDDHDVIGRINRGRARQTAERNGFGVRRSLRQCDALAAMRDREEVRLAATERDQRLPSSTATTLAPGATPITPMVLS